VYVLNGKIEIMVGDHVNKLQTGDSLHFNSGIRHQMKNVGKETTELLVVIYGP
jgi:quercetin dioxygenase-like cupin family protein